MANSLNKINSGGIKDDSIVNADIKSDAAIALSKLASTPAVLTGSTNNTITTVTGANAISGEANLTYDGTTLKNTVAAENGTIAQFELSGQTNNPALLIKADESDQQITFRAGSSTSTYPSIAFDMGTVGDSVTIHPTGKITTGGITNDTTSFSSIVTTGGGSNNGGIQVHYNTGAYGGGSMTTADAAGGGLDFWTYTGNIGSEANFTKQLSISHGGNVTVNDGDLVIGTAGHGIDFSATSQASGMTSELLDSYEEGTFTPVAYKGATSLNSPSQSIGRYTRIGRTVAVNFYIFKSWDGTGVAPGGTTYWTIQGFPFNFAGANTGGYGFLSGGYVVLNSTNSNYDAADRYQANTVSTSVLNVYSSNGSTNWTSGNIEFSGSGVMYVA